MQEFFDIYTIIFLALAVFVILKLRSVLGQRTGTERPPFDPFKRPEPLEEVRKVETPENNVIPLPTMTNRPPALLPEERLKGIADPVSPAGKGLMTLMATDNSFDPTQFVQGARAAYEMIVLAFGKGDRKALKNLLSKEVFEGFAGAIDAREQLKQTVETTFVSIDRAEIIEAALKDREMQVTLRFASKLINATRNSAGEVIEGSAEKVNDLVDVWTFARQANSRDPNWLLVATDNAQ